MGFQELAEGRLRSRYERLATDDVKAARPRRSWVKKMNGRLKGLRLSRSRKLILKGFSVVLVPRRVVRIYTDIVNRMMVDVLNFHIDFGPCFPCLQFPIPILVLKELPKAGTNCLQSCFHALSAQSWENAGSVMLGCPIPIDT
ncbi:hypothetical protein AAG906_006256 [Vitis piasezkii]